MNHCSALKQNAVSFRNIFVNFVETTCNMDSKNGNILVVDDDKDILLTARVILKKEYNRVDTISSPGELKPALARYFYHVVLLDMNFKTGATSGREGMELLREIMEISPASHVVMMTAYGDIDLAVKAMKEGATDFIVKPWENKKLLATLYTAYKLCLSNLEIKSLRDRQDMLSRDIDHPFQDIIGTSPAMREVFENIHKVAGTDANVLILGENGTGKELVARAIHRKSKRSGQIFVSVDLGSLPETLFESELFGHQKGAFTDAKETKAGRFEIASGGTLFLDEIGNLSLPLQAKILSVIQNREIYRLGSVKSFKIDIRLISATNMPLKEMVKENRFRQDLLYRINTVELHLPPLRERAEDIMLLAQHFLNVYTSKYKKKKISIPLPVQKKLKSYYWPGNVRELQHVIERAVIMNETGKISENDLMIQADQKTSAGEVLNLEEIEKETIKKALRKNQGNLSKAADELGLGRTTLYRKIEKFGL